MDEEAEALGENASFLGKRQSSGGRRRNRANRAVDLEKFLSTPCSPAVAADECCAQLYILLPQDLGRSDEFTHH